MVGFTLDCGSIAKTARLGQLACFGIGCFIFFDDYANCLLVGETMRPLLDTLFISREKLSFLVDATAAPVASLAPVSSWIGYEVDLIQEQIDRIIAIEGTEDIGIKTSGFGVFLQSIKYRYVRTCATIHSASLQTHTSSHRYYPIFMIVLMFVLIMAGRDMGPMLIAERKARVYEITDGGDGSAHLTESVGKDSNQPEDDTPPRSWNMVGPVLLLIFFIFWLLVQTGTIEGEQQTFMEKIENSDSYSSLLWGTMATVWCTIIFYLLQIVQDGRLVWPNKTIMKNLFLSWRRKAKEDDALPTTRFIMTVYECVESLLFGMARIFPALIILTLAWASGAVMVAVGADRLFSSWIVGGIDPRALPTLTFLVSMMIALATGTSWGT